MSGTILRRRDRTARPPRVEHYSSAVNRDRKVTADFHRRAATQRRYRFRLSALALAVAVPAFFVPGVLLEQQFQIVPFHDPTSGWSAHIWQNYGRTIVDCAEDARRTNKAIECRFPVHAP